MVVETSQTNDITSPLNSKITKLPSNHKSAMCELMEVGVSAIVVHISPLILTILCYSHLETSMLNKLPAIRQSYNQESLQLHGIISFY